MSNQFTSPPLSAADIESINYRLVNENITKREIAEEYDLTAATIGNYCLTTKEINRLKHLAATGSRVQEIRRKRPLLTSKWV